MPAGTVFGSASAIRFTFGSARSPADWMVNELSALTTMTSEFDSRLLRVSFAMSPFFSKPFILASSAEKKMSAGAPSSICRARKLEAPKLNTTFSPVSFA